MVSFDCRIRRNYWYTTMRLPMLPDVLFDEFPTDEVKNRNRLFFLQFHTKYNGNWNFIFQKVKVCIFTQPKFPEKDYSKYRENVMYCGTESTIFVLASLKVSNTYSHLPSNLSILTCFLCYCCCNLFRDCQWRRFVCCQSEGRDSKPQSHLAFELFQPAVFLDRWCYWLKLMVRWISSEVMK